jgi:endoglucanase
MKNEDLRIVVSRSTARRAHFYFLAVWFVLSSLLTTGASAVPAQTATDTSLAKARAKHLQRGINLSHWFAQAGAPQAYTKEHFDTYDTAADMALIKAMGFDHVRFTLNCDPMFRRGQADQIPADYLAMVDSAVKMILDQGLAVIIDIHPESDFKAKLVSDDAFVEQFEDYWRALATHFSNLDPDKVFFEILNEPEFHDRYRWMGVQARLTRAIREGAPNHTIIAAGANWSAPSELLFLEPLHDPNIIYNFHFYEPHIFTHQGATWSTNFQHYLGNLPYPSTPENVQAAMAQVPDPIHQQEVLQYGLARWNAARIDAEIGVAAAWAKKWNVPLTCNEFGVYRKTAAPADREAWIHDVRTALEKYGIGWTMWDYAGGFSVVERKDGKTTPDDGTLKALGLKKSQ